MAAQDAPFQISNAPTPRESFKLVLVGNVQVGKSSLVLRFVESRFDDHHKYSVGAAFATKTVIVNGNTVKFDIWDTAGQEQFRSLIPMYYRGAHAAIVVYDITNNETFFATQWWVEELRNHADPNIIIGLAGNKADLTDRRVVKFMDAQQYANENGLLFMETSAKTAMNIDDIFLTIAKTLNPGDVQPENSQEHSGRGGGSCCKK